MYIAEMRKKLNTNAIFLYPIVNRFMIGCYDCDDILSKLG